MMGTELSDGVNYFLGNVVQPYVYWGYSPEVDMHEVNKSLYNHDGHRSAIARLSSSAENAYLYGYRTALTLQSVKVPCIHDDVVYLVEFVGVKGSDLMPTTWPSPDGGINNLLSIYKDLGFFKTDECAQLGEWAFRREPAEGYFRLLQSTITRVLCETTSESQVRALWPDLFKYLNLPSRNYSITPGRVPQSFVDPQILATVRMAGGLVEYCKEPGRTFDAETMMAVAFRPSTLKKFMEPITAALLIAPSADTESPLYQFSTQISCSRLRDISGASIRTP